MTTQAIINRCYDYNDLRNKLDLLIDQLQHVKQNIINCANDDFLEFLIKRKLELQEIITEIIVKYL